MRKVLYSFIFSLLAACLAMGQSQLGSGAINGTVTDPDGRTVEGAQVRVLNINTGQERQAKTGDEGQFVVLVLPTGEYTVSITKQGFASFRQEHVIVSVGESASVIAKMRIGANEQVVQVEAPPIDTVKTDQSSDVDFEQIQSLPLNGRRVDQLALLTPGVTRSGTFGLLTYHGMAPAFNNYMVEGNDNNQAYFAEGRGRTRIATNISEDAVQEFQVGGSNFLPEFGRATGGSINAVIRSGTNGLHGDGFWYYRDQNFNATDPLAQGLKPDETRHQFGGSVGGPIIKNRLFFFLNFDAQQRDFPLLTVDTTHALTNGCVAAPGAAPLSPQTIADCKAGVQFLDSKFPGGAPGNALPRNFNHYLGLAKVDWTINQANTLSVSYNHLTHSALNGIQTALVLGNVGGNGSDDVRLENLNARLTTVVSSNIVNEFRTQWGRDFEFEFANQPPPNVAVGGFSFGEATFLQRAALPDERHYQFVDNLSWITGKHAFKFGAEFNRVRDIINNPANFGGAFSYANVAAFGQDLLNPGQQNYSTFTQSFGLGVNDFSTNQYGFFVQDQWKLTKNLTVNYGVRYDYQALPNPTAPNPALPNTLAYNADTTNIGPRIGFAFDPRGDGKTVIRGGYGMFYANTPMGTIDNAMRETGINDPTKGLLSVRLQPNNPGAPVFPNTLVAAPAKVNLQTFQLASNFQRPRAQEVNFGVEQEVFRQTTISAMYIYNKGDRLPLNFVTNMPTPNFTRTFQLPDGTSFQVPFVAVPSNAGFASNTVLSSTGESTYHALEIEARHRFSHGYELHLAYTLSRTINQTGTGIGDGSAPEGPFGGGNLFDQFNLNADRGRDATDQTHRLVINGVWNLPYGKEGNSWYNALIRNFSVSGLGTLESGRPYDIGISAGNLPFTSNGQTFQGLGGILGQGSFSLLPTVPRNNINGRPNYRLDTRVTRTFKLTERFQMQVLGEAFNLFNHSNFTGFTTTEFNAPSDKTLGTAAPTAPVKLTLATTTVNGVNIPQFGLPSQDGGQPDGTGARRFQLGLKFTF
ncbi:MAG TPA: TonB-dependent receptor [Candidatus Angelobacter sp.]|nr:TonB-dependent receptor [Candidatus Angelobacter sp.]